VTESIHVRLDGQTFGIRPPFELSCQKSGTHDEVIHGGEGIAYGVWESVVKKISLLVTFRRVKRQDDDTRDGSGSRSNGGAAGKRNRFKGLEHFPG
jgi:hypothetical protein